MFFEARDAQKALGIHVQRNLQFVFVFVTAVASCVSETTDHERFLAPWRSKLE
jgi:hypothetical protein